MTGAKNKQNDQQAIDHDVVIVGGGLVGASLACALSGHGLKLALVERIALTAPSQPSYDDRSLALSRASCNIFRNLGLWEKLNDDVTPIREVIVSARGQFGLTRIRADELGVSELGHVVAGRVIGAAMHQTLPELEDLTLYCPAEVTALAQQKDRVSLNLKQVEADSTLSARLVVAADGADSPLRGMLGLAAKSHDYRQNAIIANVTPEHDHRGRAFERFTPTGPMAMLPHVGKRCGLVWTCRSDQLDELMALGDEEFIRRLQREFGYRLGRIHRIGKRASYSLRLVHATEQVAGRALIMGNAAHAIHPVSAQGFNLGLRDVATLAELLLQQHSENGDIADAGLLARYQQLRRPDQEGIINYTDGLVRLFAQPFGPIRVLRSLALVATELASPLKQELARRTMGFGGHVPALARAPGESGLEALDV